MQNTPTVYVVDDDAPARESVCALTRSRGIASRAFASAEEFLGVATKEMQGCVVTDLRLGGRTGVEMQEELLSRDIRIPVIVLTGFARTPVTVRAMRNGAITMLDKPYQDDDLWQAIRQALALDAEYREKCQRKNEILARLERLTPSENHVLQLIMEGVPNKSIALRLDVSERTVESRRHEIFSKLEARSVAELVRLVIATKEEYSPR